MLKSAAKLQQLGSLSGVRGAVLVGADGLALEAHGADAELLAAELTALRATLERFARRVGAGSVSRLAFTTEQLDVVVVTAGEFNLAVSVTRGTDTRPAQQELARIAASLDARVPA